MRLHELSSMVVAFVMVSCAVAAQAATIDMVTVGNAGNGSYIVGEGEVGAVDYAYQIGKYETTVAQYCEFLNAVAKTDDYELWSSQMEIGTWGGIQRNMILRSGDSGSYSYTIGTPPGAAAGTSWNNRPIGYTSWGDAARFCNWLTNGQPTATTAQQRYAATEVGSYFLDGAMTNDALAAVVREESAVYVLPNDNEWFKAAFHKNNGVTADYWRYATQSDADPSKVLTNPDPGNNVNYRPSGDASTYSLGLPYVHTEGGEYENSESAYGTFDQNGNVLEWNELMAYGSTPADPGERLWAGGSAAEGTAFAAPLWQFLRADTCFAGNGNTYESFNLGFRIASLEIPAVDVTWTGGTNSTWTPGTGNWKATVGGAAATFGNGVNVIFDDSATGTTTADIAANVTPTSVTFNNSSKTYTVTGTAGITGAATVLKQGSGTVTMGSVNSYTGVTTVEAGKLILQGSAKAMVPVLSNGGANIKGGILVLDYLGEADPVTNVKSLLTASYNAGAWNTGKFQSTAATSARGLGWSDNTGTSKINVAYTLYGDANLDGTTNFTDLSKLLSKYNQTGVWSDGDFNYDGTVNFLDLSKMLSNYNQTVGTLTPSPEPSSLILLVTSVALMGGWLIRRRNRVA